MFPEVNSSGNCTNINECLLGTHTCRSGALQCVDTAGSFNCNCPAGYGGDECLNITNCSSICSEYANCEMIGGNYTCSCWPGFSGNGQSCADIDECSLQGSCHENSSCINVIGNYTCTCSPGYTGDGYWECNDTSVCILGSHSCHANATCINTTGSIECSCLVGFSGSGTHCADVDECASDETNVCPRLAAGCLNAIGSYRCACATGYTGEY